MFTTRDIAQVVDPGDGSILAGRLFIPNPADFPPPWPCYIGTHSPGMKYDDLQSPGRIFGGIPNIPMSGLADWGILCMAFNVRGCLSLGPGAPGQTSSGTWPQQTDDFHEGIRYCRQGGGIETIQGMQVTGYVGGAGGSGAAHHALYCAIEGTPGDDKAEAAVSLSGPLDFGFRGGDTNNHFVDVLEHYCETTDIVVMRQKGPTGLNLAGANALRITNGDNENQPTDQANAFNALMVAAGPPANYYFEILTGNAGRAHAFAEWPFVYAAAIPWILARIAEYTPGGPPPPPPPDPTGRVRVVAEITNLSPGIPYTLNVGAHAVSSNLDGPVTSFDFVSDRADGGGGTLTAPEGVYALVNAVEGVITGDIATRAWLGFAYVDGGLLPTSWRAINGASPSSFDWSQTDAFLGACFANNKLGGLAISMGIRTPLWIYQGSHSVRGFAVSQPNSGTIPLPWDPNYLQVVKRFIKELSGRYATNSSLSYIVVGGMGQLLDTILVQAAADYNNLNNLAVIAGYPNLITGWAQTSAGILDVWSKAFPTKPVYLALELPVPSINGGLTGIDEFARSSMQRYKSRLGLMTLQLDGLTGADGNLSLNSIIRDANKIARAYRFLRPSSDPACDPTQEPTGYDPELGLRNAANAGIAIGVQMEEFYEEDILNVTAPYPADFAQFQTDLKANAV